MASTNSGNKKAANGGVRDKVAIFEGATRAYPSSPRMPPDLKDKENTGHSNWQRENQYDKAGIQNISSRNAKPSSETSLFAEESKFLTEDRGRRISPRPRAATTTNSDKSTIGAAIGSVNVELRGTSAPNSKSPKIEPSKRGTSSHSSAKFSSAEPTHVKRDRDSARRISGSSRTVEASSRTTASRNQTRPDYASRSPRELKSSRVAASASYNTATGHAILVNNVNTVVYDRPLEEQDYKCLQDLKVLDLGPQDDKTAIEDRNFDLCQDYYTIICTNPNYDEWKSNDKIPLLWIHCQEKNSVAAVAAGNELEDSLTVDETIESSDSLIPKSPPVFYHFCDDNDEHHLNGPVASIRNNPLTALRSVLHQLIDRDLSLIYPLKDKSIKDGKKLYDQHAMSRLREIFLQTVENPRVERVYVIVGSIDECHSRNSFFSWIFSCCRKWPKVKWLITSSYDGGWIESKVEQNVSLLRIDLDQAQKPANEIKDFNEIAKTVHNGGVEEFNIILSGGDESSDSAAKEKEKEAVEEGQSDKEKREGPSRNKNQDRPDRIRQRPAVSSKGNTEPKNTGRQYHNKSRSASPKRNRDWTDLTDHEDSNEGGGCCCLIM